jgi:hypothetical protein
MAEGLADGKGEGIRRGLDSVGLYGHGRRFHPVGRLETLSAGERVCPLALVATLPIAIRLAWGSRVGGGARAHVVPPQSVGMAGNSRSALRLHIPARGRGMKVSSTRPVAFMTPTN